MTISGSGFEPNLKSIAIGQCVEGYVGPADCNLQGGATFRDADASGNVAAFTIVVKEKFGANDCTKVQCVIAAGTAADRRRRGHGRRRTPSSSRSASARPAAAATPTRRRRPRRRPTTTDRTPRCRKTGAGDSVPVLMLGATALLAAGIGVMLLVPGRRRGEHAMKRAATPLRRRAVRRRWPRARLGRPGRHRRVRAPTTDRQGQRHHDVHLHRRHVPDLRLRRRRSPSRRTATDGATDGHGGRPRCPTCRASSRSRSARRDHRRARARPRRHRGHAHGQRQHHDQRRQAVPGARPERRRSPLRAASCRATVTSFDYALPSFSMTGTCTPTAGAALGTLTIATGHGADADPTPRRRRPRPAPEPRRRADREPDARPRPPSRRGHARPRARSPSPAC